MNIGMLWQDDSKTDLYGKIQRAVDYYISKYGKVPNRCFVHPSAVPDGEQQRVGPVELVGHKSVRLNHFWMGVEEEGCQQ